MGERGVASGVFLRPGSDTLRGMRPGSENLRHGGVALEGLSSEFRPGSENFSLLVGSDRRRDGRRALAGLSWGLSWSVLLTLRGLSSTVAHRRSSTGKGRLSSDVGRSDGKSLA
jgi:hypothetical protein